MPDFTFDLKMFVTVHVKAADEASARAAIEKVVPDLIEGGNWGGPDVAVFINSASADGEADLVEVDGEEPEAIALAVDLGAAL